MTVRLFLLQKIFSDEEEICITRRIENRHRYVGVVQILRCICFFQEIIMLCSSPIRCTLVAGLLALTLNATAEETKGTNPNAGMRYAGINIQSDDQDNRQITGAVSLTIGKHSWVQVGAGAIHIQQQHDTLNPALFTLGGGLAGQQLSASLYFNQRRDGDRYHQRDWSSSLDWHNNKLELGIDGLHRNTELRGTVPVTSNQGNTVNAPVSQSLTGNGIGLHARINLTQRLAISLGGMHYSYDSKIRQDAVNMTNSNNSGLVGSVPDSLLNNQSLLTNPLLTQVSGAIRETAILQDTWNAGVIYRWPKIALGAQYFNDTAIDNAGTLKTGELYATFFIDEHWGLSPGIGYSAGNHAGGVMFGLITARYGW